MPTADSSDLRVALRTCRRCRLPRAPQGSPATEFGRYRTLQVVEAEKKGLQTCQVGQFHRKAAGQRVVRQLHRLQTDQASQFGRNPALRRLDSMASDSKRASPPSSGGIGPDNALWESQSSSRLASVPNSGGNRPRQLVEVQPHELQVGEIGQFRGYRPRRRRWPVHRLHVNALTGRQPFRVGRRDRDLRLPLPHRPDRHRFADNSGHGNPACPRSPPNTRGRRRPGRRNAPTDRWSRSRPPPGSARGSPGSLRVAGSGPASAPTDRHRIPRTSTGARSAEWLSRRPRRCAPASVGGQLRGRSWSRSR